MHPERDMVTTNNESSQALTFMSHPTGLSNNDLPMSLSAHESMLS